MSEKDNITLGRARHLRKRETDAERLLWSELRGRREDGLKFRRQHPIAPYIVDFAERSLRLIIELDGATHCTEAEKAYDAKRTAFLESRNWTVMRFENEDVYEDIDDVCETIWLQAIAMKDKKNND